MSSDKVDYREPEGSEDPLGSLFTIETDNETGKPVFRFDTGETAPESTVPALLCTLWYDDNRDLSALTISGVDASGHSHDLNEYFRNLDSVRVAKDNTVHLEISKSFAIRQEKGAGTLFLDNSKNALFFRIDFPNSR